MKMWNRIGFYQSGKLVRNKTRRGAALLENNRQGGVIRPDAACLLSESESFIDPGGNSLNVTAICHKLVPVCT